MSNPNIGEFDCEACEKVGRKNTRAFIRQDKNGKLYGLCPRCGKITRGNPQGQDYFLTVARMYDPEQRAAEVERANPAPVVKAEPAPIYTSPMETCNTPTPAPIPAPAPLEVKPGKSTTERAGIFDDLI